MSAPVNTKALRRAVEEAAAIRSVVPGRMQYTVASTIAMQMMPDGAAKGGGAIRHRVSEAEARLTTDLDFARATGMDLDNFVDAYSDRLEHYRKLQRYGYDSYITQNRLDLAVAGEYAWTEDMRAQYPELRQDVQAEIIHQGESSPTSVERLGTASASILMGTPPPAGHHVVLRLPTGIERLAVVTRTDRESGRCHLLFDTYSSLPVAPADSPYWAQLTFDLPDSSATVVAISAVMLRLERALTRLDRRGTEIVRISRMRLASPLEIQLTVNELVDTFLKVATALVGLRLAWYQATKTQSTKLRERLSTTSRRDARRSRMPTMILSRRSRPRRTPPTPLCSINLRQTSSGRVNRGR